MKITAEIDAICTAMVELYREQLKNDGAYATGYLVQNITYQLDIRDDGVSLYFVMPKYSMYSPESKRENKVPRAAGAHPYANAHPSQQMIINLDDWIRAKNLDLNPYAIAKKIMVDGWKNEPRENFKKFLESATMAELKDALAQEIKLQIKQEITDYISNIFK